MNDKIMNSKTHGYILTVKNSMKNMLMVPIVNANTPHVSQPYSFRILVAEMANIMKYGIIEIAFNEKRLLCVIGYRAYMIR